MNTQADKQYRNHIVNAFHALDRLVGAERVRQLNRERARAIALFNANVLSSRTASQHHVFLSLLRNEQRIRCPKITV